MPLSWQLCGIAVGYLFLICGHYKSLWHAVHGNFYRAVHWPDSARVISVWSANRTFRSAAVVATKDQ
jgi:hypothetical protein